MTTEEKAKAYDEAKARISKAYNDNRCTIGFMNEIFPELKESEDEKIRKWLIELVEEIRKANPTNVEHNGMCSDAIAWLEKQYADPIKEYWRGYNEGKQNVLDKYAELEKQGEQENAERPKFKVGDFIVNNYCMGRVVELTNDAYLLDTGQGIPFSCEHNVHLWTIQDAKDGDVLMSRSPFIYGKQCPYGGLDWYNNNFIKASNFIFTDSPVHPATKEQRELLFQKMKEDGYEWLEETKELKKIEQKPTQVIKPFEAEHGKYYYCIKDYFCGGRKQASKGDVVQALRGLPIMGLKDASEYFLPVNFIKCNHAWSEEDESIALGIEQLCNCASLLNIAPDKIDKIRTWLKSLKERYTWKPSDEQMKALHDLNLTGNISYAGQGQVLIGLYNDLKKLKGE